MPCGDGVLQVPVPVVQGDQVLPDDAARLGGGGPSGVQAGLQHAQPAHTPQEPQLPASRLQLQPEAGQDAHHQGKPPPSSRPALRDSPVDQLL